MRMQNIAHRRPELRFRWCNFLPRGVTKVSNVIFNLTSSAIHIKTKYGYVTGAYAKLIRESSRCNSSQCEYFAVKNQSTYIVNSVRGASIVMGWV